MFLSYNWFRLVWASTILALKVFGKLPFALSENILNGSSDKPFLFFHIPKTGGSTVKGFLYNQLYVHLKRHVFFPAYAGIPGAKHEAEVTKIKHIREIFECSVAIISHFSPINLGISFFINTLGIYGQSHCRKQWWDDKNIYDYIPMLDSGFSSLQTVSKIKKEIKYGNKSVQLKQYFFNNRYKINFDKLAIDVVQNSNCMIIFREPISRMWSWYHFFKYPRFSNITFYEYLDTFGVEGMYNLTGKNIQSLVAGGENTLLRKTIFNRCYIGVQEHYEIVKDFLHSSHPFLREEIKFPKHHLSESSKEINEKMNDFPVYLRNELKVLLKDDAKLWKQAYFQVTGNHNYSVQGCDWCETFWHNLDESFEWK